MSIELFFENCLPAERALLGSLLLHPERAKDMQLQTDDFLFVDHGFIWDAMQTVAARGDEPIPALVMAELRATQHLPHLGESLAEDIGGHEFNPFYGEAYLNDLTAHPEAYEDPAPFAYVVKSLAARRRLYEYHQHGERNIFEQGRNIYDILSEDETRLLAIKQTIYRQRSGGLQPVSLAIPEDALDSDANYEAYKAAIGAQFQTGYPDLDKQLDTTGGVLTIIGARPRVGKSALMQSIVYNLMLAPFIRSEVVDEVYHSPLPGGKFLRVPPQAEIDVLPRVAFFSLEMPAAQLTKRWVAMMTGISASRQKKGQITREEFSHVQDAKYVIKMLHDKLLLMCGGMTVETMVSEARAFMPDVIFSDYAQLYSSAQKYTGEVEKIGIVTAQHKALAMELNIPVFCGAQVNRAGEHGPDRGPTLEELKGSGSLEQDADNVVFIHRPELSKKGERRGEADLIITKQRDGDTGELTMMFDGPRTQFLSLYKP